MFKKIFSLSVSLSWRYQVFQPRLCGLASFHSGVLRNEALKRGDGPDNRAVCEAFQVRLPKWAAKHLLQFFKAGATFQKADSILFKMHPPPFVARGMRSS